MPHDDGPVAAAPAPETLSAHSAARQKPTERAPLFDPLADDRPRPLGTLGDVSQHDPAPPPAPATRKPSSRPTRASGGGGVARILIGVLCVAVLGVGAWFGGGWLGMWGAAKSDAAPAAATPSGASRPALAAAKPVSTPPAPAAPAAPATNGLDVGQLLGGAQAALAQHREADAVALLEQAVQQRPDDLDIQVRLEKARALLRERQAADVNIAEAKSRYAQEDYAEALRLLYRIPQPHQPAGVNRWIANGWFNLGVQRLQTTDLGEAIEYFGNCLEIQPEDGAARRARDVARRYRSVPFDDAYRIFVRNQRVRGLDDRS
jgi:predicted lipid-binding transport protein (Tim44 family)